MPSKAGDGPARRYAAFKNGADELVIYDTENAEAWVMSDYYARLGE